jgi:hypothetical protein
MGIVKNLVEKAKSTNTTYLKLLQRYKFNNNLKYLIFEGFDDQSFYLSHFPSNLEYDSFISNGKKKSIDLYESIDWNTYSKSRILFFIDRDFDRILNLPIPGDHNIYETTYYSIENYVVNENMLRRILRELFHFYETDEINRIISLFQSALNSFKENIKPIITWILLVKSKGQKPNLNGIDLSRFYNVDNNLNFIISKINKTQNLEVLTQVKTPAFALSEYRNFAHIVAALPDYKLYLRGKFELWFFLKFLNSIHPYLNQLGHKKSLKTNLSQTNAIEVLGPRTTCPLRLYTFVDSIMKAV